MIVPYPQFTWSGFTGCDRGNGSVAPSDPDHTQKARWGDPTVSHSASLHISPWRAETSREAVQVVV